MERPTDTGPQPSFPAPPTDLDRRRVFQSLETHTFGRSIAAVHQTGSTNDDAREASKSGAPSGHVVWADHQLSGRGTHGRAWDSPGGQDLYFSVLVRGQGLPTTHPRLGLLTLALGLAVAEAVDTVTGRTSTIKWPNDLLFEGKKCCGILVEARSAGAQLQELVLGIGLNVNRQAFPPELAATSLRLETGRKFERPWLLGTVLNQLERRFFDWRKAGGDANGHETLRQAIEDKLADLNQPMRWNGAPGRAEGLQADGSLRWSDATGTRSIYHGTLSRTDQRI